MSKELGEKAIKQLVNRVLEKSQVFKDLSANYRKQLNSKYHILDLSREALYSTNVKSKSAKEKGIFDRAYSQFIQVLLTTMGTRVYPNLDSISSIPVTTVFVQVPPLLISPSFTASRNNITAVSRQIPGNKYFGTSNRSRKLSEVMREESKTEEELVREGRIFDPKLGTELTLDPITNRLVARTRSLSKVDLGHTPGIEQGRDSPLSEQILNTALAESAVKRADFKDLEFYDNLSEVVISTANSNITGILLEKLSALTRIQAECTVAFKNEVPEKLAELTGSIGFLSLTLQLYSVNNSISVQETAVRNKLLAEIKAELRKVVLSIPGSNTIEEDLKIALKQKLLNSISGKGSAAKLKKHAVLHTAQKIKSKAATKPTPVTNSVLAATGKKIPTSKNVAVVIPNLLRLQNLINQQLQDVISANMGGGSSTTLLNYRTGRFASSVKVEQLSQGRTGMLTAFYSYMRNPYGTFSDGGKQQFPQTRDPKLLIARSIRQIAEQQVTNRMRSVLV